MSSKLSFASVVAGHASVRQEAKLPRQRLRPQVQLGNEGNGEREPLIPGAFFCFRTALFLVPKLHLGMHNVFEAQLRQCGCRARVSPTRSKASKTTLASPSATWERGQRGRGAANPGRVFLFPHRPFPRSQVALGNAQCLRSSASPVWLQGTRQSDKKQSFQDNACVPKCNLGTRATGKGSR